MRAFTLAAATVLCTLASAQYTINPNNVPLSTRRTLIRVTVVVVVVVFGVGELTASQKHGAFLNKPHAL